MFKHGLYFYCSLKQPCMSLGLLTVTPEKVPRYH
ncbi:hypothetical protein PDIG_57710 [Penicillium digitatum PHI26]|uniref:Uncharacterized protein n=2 Tax=Penicillium digitatum TaxID=36651 RepID=K9FKH9_PEND2|nr:hypothetical protein PDIP_67220 [Penicillium digitatum Pd1]EKV08570.1 hypothetical protein PDIP_67220 [Penicillium digitatum Pd1]EKV10080.1 hypothetical protein PDIG_57710 [Penicillium digitatum PHI26]